MIHKIYESNVTQKDNERHKKFEKDFEAVVNKLMRATNGKYKGWIEKTLHDICAARFKDGWETAKDLYEDIDK